MYVCLCFGVTEKQVHDQIDAGACSPRQIASACKAGTDCGGCVRRIQAMLGRPSVCARRGGGADGAASRPELPAALAVQPPAAAVMESAEAA